MTIAISFKVNDGLVLAADSAATLITTDQNGNSIVSHVYNHANKIINLRKGLPLGFICWGSGSIGNASIARLMKDLRRRLSGEDQDHLDWDLNPQSYTVEAVANRVREYLFDECYVPTFADWPGQKPALGCIIAGYSSGNGMAEEWEIQIQPDGTCLGPRLVRPIEDCGLSWNGDPEPIHRLIKGYGRQLPSILQTNLGVPAEQIEPAMGVISAALETPLFTPPMPIQDAIDLAEFLTELTIRWSRFTPGAAMVGGPIELAAITKHEGFQWVQRKFYYHSDLNPKN